MFLDFFFFQFFLLSSMMLSMHMLLSFVPFFYDSIVLKGICFRLALLKFRLALLKFLGDEGDDLDCNICDKIIAILYN